MVEVANSSSVELEVESFEMSSGKKVEGPDEGSVIPARQLGLNAVSYYTFEKKWGLTGIVGKIKFKATPKMKNGLTIEFSVPYSGDNTAKVSAPITIMHFNDGTSAKLGVKAHCNISSSSGWFPRVLVYVEDIAQ